PRYAWRNSLIRRAARCASSLRTTGRRRRAWRDAFASLGTTTSGHFCSIAGRGSPAGTNLRWCRASLHSPIRAGSTHVAVWRGTPALPTAASTIPSRACGRRPNGFVPISRAGAPTTRSPRPSKDCGAFSPRRRKACGSIDWCPTTSLSSSRRGQPASITSSARSRSSRMQSPDAANASLPASSVPRPAPRVISLVPEDWYFISHRLPMARAARNAGFEVHVATRIDRHGAAIEAEGFHLHPVSWRRGSLDPRDLVRVVREVRKLYRGLRPDLAHHVALPATVVGSLAAIGLPVVCLNA